MSATTNTNTSPTTLLYLPNPHLYEANAHFESIQAYTDETQVIFLDQTIFYPQGGGQPFDVGTLESSAARFVVEEVRMKEGRVMHIGHFEKGSFEAGEKVSLNIDAQKRMLHARLHSAGHLIDEALLVLGYTWKPTKGQHFPSQSSVCYEGSFEAGEGEKIKALLDEQLAIMIQTDAPIKSKFVSFEELQNICDDIPENLPQDKPVSVCVLWDNRATPCGGTHAPSLGAIGNITIRKIKSKKGEIKISYDLLN